LQRRSKTEQIKHRRIKQGNAKQQRYGFDLGEISSPVVTAKRRLPEIEIVKFVNKNLRLFYA